MSLRIGYAVATVAVFAIEVLIALFVHDGVIRPFGGDVLAVILVYLGLRAVTPLRVMPAVVVALLIAAAIEFGQLFHLLDALGLRGNRVARIVLGGSFDLKDFVAYGLGGLGAVLAEAMRREPL